MAGEVNRRADGPGRIDPSFGPPAHERIGEDTRTVAAKPFWITARLVILSKAHLTPLAHSTGTTFINPRLAGMTSATSREPDDCDRPH
jgi:hypothetical protein